MNNKTLLDSTVDLLNQALDSDTAGISSLMEKSIVVNKNLAHCTALHFTQHVPGGLIVLDFLGLLNGILEEAGYDKIICEYDEDGFLVKKFKVVERINTESSD